MAMLSTSSGNLSFRNAERIINLANDSTAILLGCGLGFLLAMVLFAGLRSRIDETNIPRPFKGLAVTLIAASFISLAFMGFAGIVDALFA